MKLIRVTRVLGLLVSLGAAQPAMACETEGSHFAIVGLLSGDRLLVREEFKGEHGLEITLYLLDARASSVTEFAVILDRDDPEPAREREKVRAKRWKAAEAKLKQQGLVLKTLTPRKLPFTLAGATISTEGRPQPEEDGVPTCFASALVATRGKDVQTLDTTQFCGSSDGARVFGGAYVTPDEKYLIPSLESECLFGTSWLKAIPVSSFAAPAR